jgi:hypothetical protein
MKTPAGSCDLGFVRQSDVFEPVLRKALGR